MKYEIEPNQEEEREPEVLRPITNKEWWVDPNRPKQFKTPQSLKHLPIQAREIAVWVKRQHIQNSLPISQYKLLDLPIGELRFIASQFKSYSGEDMRSYTKNQLVQFIQGHQQTAEQLISLGPPPHIDLPLLS